MIHKNLSASGGVFSSVFSMTFVKRIIRLSKKHSLSLFLLSIFLLRIPPFYVFFPIRNILFTTLGVSATILLALFTLSLYQSFQKKIFLTKKKNLIFILFLIYFFFQSITIFNTRYIEGFLVVYKNIFLSGVALFLILKYQISYQRIVSVLLVTMGVNFLYQMFMFFDPGIFEKLAEIFIHEPHFQLVEINLKRSRLFIETYDEAIIPFIVILLAKSRQRNQKIALFSLLAMASIPALLSRFRTRILMLVFSFFLSIIFFLKEKPAFKKNLVFLLVLLSFLSYTVSASLTGHSFVDRLIPQEGENSFHSIEARISNILQSLEIGLSNPSLGVGLGNYLSRKTKTAPSNASLPSWKAQEGKIASRDPHNILARTLVENGLIGLTVLILIMSYFFINDVKILKKNHEDQYRKGFIISFWTVFLYSLFNPTTTLSYNVFFWTLRGLI